MLRPATQATFRYQTIHGDEGEEGDEYIHQSGFSYITLQFIIVYSRAATA